MSDFIFEQSGDIGLLHLSGELTEHSVEKLRQGLTASFERSDLVVVDLEKVTGLDAGCFRLFCAAYRICTGCNKRLFVISPGPKVFRALDAAGRPERSSHCASKCRDGCLWNN